MKLLGHLISIVGVICFVALVLKLSVHLYLDASNDRKISLNPLRFIKYYLFPIEKPVLDHQRPWRNICNYLQRFFAYCFFALVMLLVAKDLLRTHQPKALEEVVPSAVGIYVSPSVIDSLTWLYYAYTFQGQAVFRDGTIEGMPSRFPVKVDTIVRLGDSIVARFYFFKDYTVFSHTLGAMNLNGFIYYNGAAKPLTGGLVFDGFEKWENIKNDNVRADSLFMLYLRQTDSSSLNSWLLSEGRRRRVWE